MIVLFLYLNIHDAYLPKYAPKLQKALQFEFSHDQIQNILFFLARATQK